MRLPPSCQTRWPSDSYRHLPNDVGVWVLGGFLSALRVCADALVGHSILRIERQAEATHVSCSRDRVNKRRCKRTYKQPHPSAKARQATRRVELRRKTIARMPPDSGRGAPAAPDGAATPKKKAWARPTAAGWAALAGRVTPTAAPTTRCASATGSIASTRRRETCASTGTIRTAAPSSRRRAARRGDPDRVADRDSDGGGESEHPVDVQGGKLRRRSGRWRGGEGTSPGAKHGASLWPGRNRSSKYKREGRDRKREGGNKALCSPDNTRPASRPHCRPKVPVGHVEVVRELTDLVLVELIRCRQGLEVGQPLGQRGLAIKRGRHGRDAV